MSESTDAEPATDSGISGDAGFERLVGEAAAEEREKQERVTEAEKQKQRIMRERGETDADAPPVTVYLDAEEFAFSPLPKKVRVWMENSSFEFLGLNEAELENHPEKGEEFRRVRDRTISILAENARADAFDADFWRDWVGLEERMGLINDILEAQDERQGN